MENMMMNIMYEIPSRTDITDVIITADYVNGKGKPEYLLKEVVNLDNKISGEIE